MLPDGVLHQVDLLTNERSFAANLPDALLLQGDEAGEFGVLLVRLFEPLGGEGEALAIPLDLRFERLDAISCGELLLEHPVAALLEHGLRVGGLSANIQSRKQSRQKH